VDKLPRVIWSHNTTASRTTKFTPFKLLYGEEAMTLEEIRLRSWRTSEGAQQTTEDDLKPTIDTIEIVKMQAAIDLAKYQDETQRQINKKVKPREIKEGNLMLRCILKSMQKGKMHSKWEGPFIVASMERPEACRL